MKKMSAKRVALLVLAVLMAVVAVGSTVAYLVDKTPPVKNTFTPVAVSCEVQEDFDEVANTKQNVSVKNTGDVAAYIRVALVVTWVKDEGGTTYGGAPVSGTDYTLVLAENGWVRGADGFYYCKTAIAAGDTTPTLVQAIAPVAGRAPEDYHLSVQIISSAIQADPARAVTSAWRGVTVNPDGTITPQ